MSAAGHPSGLVTRDATLERARPPRWAWNGWLVLGYLNLILGNEGVGKGTLIAWLIAQLTHGRLPGDLYGQPVGVGILGDEDSFDDVWTPRLHAADADLTRVHQIERPDGASVELRSDRDQLAATIESKGMRALFADALLDNLGVGVDDWRSKAVRDALQPFRILGRELDILTVGCLHPNKHGDSFRQLVSGSSAFNAVSRSSLLLAEHPEDEGRRVLVRGKGNLSAKPPTIEFDIASHSFDANGHTFNVPIARNFTTGDVTIDDLLRDTPATHEHSKVQDAAELIEALLPNDGDWHAAKPIYEACAGEQIDDRTVKRAKQRLGLDHRRAQTFPASTEWRWPTQATHRPPSLSVLSVPTVPSANGSIPSHNPTQDTQDSKDTQNTRPEHVPTTKDDPDTTLQDVLTKFPDLATSLGAQRIGAAVHDSRQAVS